MIDQVFYSLVERKGKIPSSLQQDESTAGDSNFFLFRLIGADRHPSKQHHL